MADIRAFRKYIEELSGNDYLKKKIVVLEKKNEKLEEEMKSLKEEIKLIKKFKDSPIPKKKGRKPRPMIKIVADEMGKKPGKTMRVTDIIKMLKKKGITSKSKNMYSSVASSLSHNPKFEKTGVGEFKLVD